MNLPIDIRPTESQLLMALPFCEGGISSSKSAPPICAVCCKTFKNRGSMRFHMKKRHGTDFDDAEENCGTLEEIFGMKGTQNGVPLRFHCPMDGCRKKGERPRGMTHFASAKLLVQHFQKKHTEKRHRCAKCSARFALERDLRYHQKKLCPSAKCSVRTETSVPNSNLRFPPPMPNDDQFGKDCCCSTKVFLVPVQFEMRLRPILPRFSIERRTVATQTNKIQRDEGGQRLLNCSVPSQINPQFCISSSHTNFYTKFEHQNLSAVYKTPQQFHQQMHHKNNLSDEFLRCQSVQCQTNFHPTTSTMDFGAQFSTSSTTEAIAVPPTFLPLSSHIYLPPLLTSSSTQTAAQMLQHQCSQTTADPPSDGQTCSSLPWPNG